MPKVLSKSGDSLADSYDVEGSVAGIEELQSRDVSLIHEMGGVLVSERLVGIFAAMQALDVAQSTTFAVVFDTSLTRGAVCGRILGVNVVADVTARVTTCQVSVARIDAGSQGDHPIWAWEVGAGTDFERVIRMQQNGGAVADVIQLVPSPGSVQIPSFTVGLAQPLPIPRIVMRGTTAAFGAGTVTIDANVYFLTPELQGVSSRGLPLPGW